MIDELKAKLKFLTLDELQEFADCIGYRYSKLHFEQERVKNENLRGYFKHNNGYVYIKDSDSNNLYGIFISNLSDKVYIDFKWLISIFSHKIEQLVEITEQQYYTKFDEIIERINE